MALPLGALVGLGGLGAGTSAGFALSKGTQAVLVLAALFLFFKFYKG